MTARKTNRFLNYTTEIEAAKTVADIQGMLVAAGARHVAIEYENNLPVALTFGVDIAERRLSFRMAANVGDVEKAMSRSKVPARYLARSQARRVAWRVLKDWTEVQLALVQLGQARMVEVFFPHALDSNGRTFFQAFEENYLRLLPPASEGEAK